MKTEIIIFLNISTNLKKMQRLSLRNIRESKTSPFNKMHNYNSDNFETQIRNILVYVKHFLQINNKNF